jgi:hypothetical protein
MIRKTKGTKRYAKQREKLFTDTLIREDEMQRVKEAQRRLSRFEYNEDGEKIYFERKHPR